jgi:hypothetical protein
VLTFFILLAAYALLNGLLVVFANCPAVQRVVERSPLAARALGVVGLIALPTVFVLIAIDLGAFRDLRDFARDAVQVIRTGSIFA